MNRKKILTITAQYPPDHAGGYELRIKDIMDRLTSTGNEVSVLTTKPSQKNTIAFEPLKYPVKRILFNRYKAKWFPKEIFQDLLDTKTLEKVILEYSPDLIYLGHTYPLNKQLFPYLASKEIPILFDEGGNCLKGAWTDHGRWFEFTGDYRSRFGPLNAVKPIIIRLVLWMGRGRIRNRWSFPDKMKMIFNSELNRSNAQFFGVPVKNAMVIHSGVDIERFTFALKQNLSSPVKILIPGRIETNKGQLDGVNLIWELAKHGIEAELFLVGPSSSDGYIDVVMKEINKLNLAKKIHIIPMVDQDQMVELYHQSDICFFSSYHRSGFSRVPLEAMACGGIVISYGNEGSDEIMKNGVNGYLVEPGDVSMVAKVICELIASPDIVTELTLNARQQIEQKHTLSSYIDQIEKIVEETANHSS